MKRAILGVLTAVAVLTLAPGVAAAWGGPGYCCHSLVEDDGGMMAIIRVLPLPS